MKTNKAKELLNRVDRNIQEYTQDLTLSNYSESLQNSTCTIYTDLRNSPIYKDYSGQSLLANEIFDFIEDTYDIVKKNLRLNLLLIFPESTTPSEQEKIQKLIKVHYAVAYKKTRDEIRKNKIVAWILLGLGSLLFLCYGLLHYFDINFIFQNIIEIFSWVFIWEACDLFVFANGSKKMELFKYVRLFDADIQRKAQ